MFLGTTMSKNLKMNISIGSIGKKAQKRMFFLSQLKKFDLPQAVLIISTLLLSPSSNHPSLSGTVQHPHNTFYRL